MSVIKYTRLSSKNILLELTTKRLKRKTELMIKKPIAGIIHKIQAFKKRLNFFDFAAIFLLIIVVLFFVYNRLQRKSEWIDVRVSVENSDWWYQGASPNYWYVKNLKVGDVSKDSFGNKTVEVVNIDNYDVGGPFRMIYVDLKIKVDFNKNKDQYLHEFKPLVVGSSLIINFPKQQLRGSVISINENERKYFYKKIKIEGRMMSPALADKIVVGAKSYDTEGNITAEVIDVKKEVASYYEFSDLRGINVKTYNPLYRDVEITLKVKTFSELNIYFYINKAALKIGNRIWFQFSDFSIEDMRIIEVSDLDL